MNPHVKNFIAVLAGFVSGSIVNMALVMLGPSVIPPPAGVDVMDAESIANSMHLFEARHFLMPFLAHALGTLVGATVAYVLAADRKALIAWAIGALFFAGGVYASTVIPAPTWFIATDLVLAYLPMAWLGQILGARWINASDE